MKKTKTTNILIFILTISLFSSGLLINLFENYNREIDNINPISSDLVIGNYTIPGVPYSTSMSQIIKIGHLNDIGHFSGDFSWEGAILAAREINENGGLLINGTPYYIGLASEDTDEGADIINTSKGVSAAERMINYNNPHFVIGGYRTQPVLAYIDVIMDAGIPFLSTGVSDDEFTNLVASNYNRYKYFFRMSANSTIIGPDVILGIIYYATLLNITYPGQIDNIGILYEDLVPYENLADTIQNYISFYTGFAIPASSKRSFSSSATYAEMANHMQQFEIDGCDIVVPLISGPAGILMNNWYETNEPNYMLIGSNLLSTFDEYWINTSGSCQYEIDIQNLHRTNKTSKSIPFWDSFLAEYDHNPFQTGANSYDAVYSIAWAINETTSFNSEIFVSQMETLVPGNELIGVSNYIAFNPNHGLVAGYPYTIPLWTQWQEGGTKIVLPYNPTYYPESLATGVMRIPPWLLSNWGVTPEIPGPFTLNHNADTPDNDSIFDLIWTDSSGADNYSIYHSNNPISIISRCSILASHYSGTTFPISGLPTGNHYFIVVAHDKNGEQLSNEIQVTVQLPAPGPFTLTTDADTPDTDGNFSLTWTASSGANNYSIYSFNTPITEVNTSLLLISYQNAISPHAISEFPSGDYYFVIVAYNETGETFSNSIQIKIRSSPPGPFTLSSDADSPDNDGNFSLTWTTSSGADNYSIYSFNTPITEVNASLSLISYQNAISPYAISEFLSGDHYFVIVAYNETGEILSNSILISINRPPSSNSPVDINTDFTGSETIDWIIYDDLNGGQYRVWVNDTNGNYYVWQDWQSWTNGTSLQVPINRTNIGIFNYTIEYYDDVMQYGISDSVIVNISRTYIPSGIMIPFDLISQTGLYIEITTTDSAYFQITVSDTNFPGINAIPNKLTPLGFYSFEIFNLGMIEDDSMIQNLLIRFYYDPLEVKNPSNLGLYHYDEILGNWILEETTLNIAQNYLEFETTSLSYFCLCEAPPTSPPSDLPIIIIIVIIILSIIGVSIPTAYVKLSRKENKRELKQKKKIKPGNEKEVYQRNDIYMLPKKVKAEPKDRNLESISSEKDLQEITKTRNEMQIQEDEDICQVHRGIIKGMIYSCPRCKTKYCLKCARVLAEKEEGCWVCNSKIIFDDNFDSNLELSIKEEIKNTPILEALENVAFIEKLDKIDLCLIDKDMWSKVAELDLNDEDKKEFIKTLLSLTPKEQIKIVDKMLELQNTDEENPII